MAESPLAEINWDNLEGQHLITAVNLLQLAFAERMNMAQLIGAFRIVNNLNLYPFLDNSPRIGKKNWPVMWGSSVPATNMRAILGNYLSETKLNNVLGTSPNNGFRELNVRLDQDTLLTDLGVTLTGNRATEYPRMDIITTENVRFWYDLITSLKYILVDFAHGGAGSNINNHRWLSSYAEGISGDIHIEFFDAITDLRYGPALPNPNPLVNLGPDWDGLWDNSVKVKQLIPNSQPAMKIRYESFGISSQFADVTAIKTYSRFDTSDYDNTGLGGAPIDIRTYGSYGDQETSTAPATAWAESNGYFEDKIIQLPTAERNVIAGNIVERSIPFDVPSNPNVDFVSKTILTNHGTYENWDGEGGFQFYTPT